MKCIIIEGPQGCGKTTLANYLRENIGSSNLYRLSGSKDKTLTGKEKSVHMYQALLTYMKAIQDVGMNLIFDRTFFSEYVYANLGYKEYTYEDAFQELVKEFVTLDYDIHYISLYLEDVNLYEERLERVHHSYQAFSLQNSVDQQKEYAKIADILEKTGKVTVHRLAMDDFDSAYAYINAIFQIQNA